MVNHENIAHKNTDARKSYETQKQQMLQKYPPYRFLRQYLAIIERLL